MRVPREWRSEAPGIALLLLMTWLISGAFAVWPWGAFVAACWIGTLALPPLVSLTDGNLVVTRPITVLGPFPYVVPWDESEVTRDGEWFFARRLAEDGEQLGNHVAFRVPRDRWPEMEDTLTRALGIGWTYA
jgi:hypothetical protein